MVIYLAALQDIPKDLRRGGAHRRRHEVAGVPPRGAGPSSPRSPCSPTIWQTDRGAAAVRPRLHDHPRRPARRRPRRSSTSLGSRRSSSSRFGYGSAVAYGLFAVTLLITIGDDRLLPVREGAGLLMAAPPTGVSPTPSGLRLPFSPWHLLLMPTGPAVRHPARADDPRRRSRPTPRSAGSRPTSCPSTRPSSGFVRPVPDAPTCCAGSSTRRSSWRSRWCSHLMLLCSLAGYGFARLRFRGKHGGVLRDRRDDHDPDPAADDPDLHHVLAARARRHPARGDRAVARLGLRDLPDAAVLPLPAGGAGGGRPHRRLQHFGRCSGGSCCRWPGRRSPRWRSSPCSARGTT